MEPERPCNLCGGTRHSLFTTKLGRHTGQRFRVVRCDACGLVFVNPRLSEAENQALYDADYFNGKGFDSSINYVMLEEEERARREESLGILAKIAVLKPGLDVRILDVGCGTGCFLKTVREAGYVRSQGLEFSTYGAELSSKNAGVRVRAGDLVSADFEGETFDVINATEVIEHVRDPMAFFRKVKALLAPGGIFLYTTGNADGLYARVLGTHWPYLAPEGHLFYFSARTLGRYFAEVGLALVDADTLGQQTRRVIARADDDIAHAQLTYVGKSDRGLKGLIFRSVGALSVAPMKRLVSLVVGKGRLPIAINGSSVDAAREARTRG